MKRSRLLILLVVMFACGIAARAQVLAGPNRPATVPEGYLVTPMGYFHPSCVKEVARGDILRPGRNGDPTPEWLLQRDACLRLSTLHGRWERSTVESLG